ncbi:MAG TPA: aldose epimerase family protein [Bacteroidales bacterium]|jgi:aldose 1-epimerase|nr:galactose mutarotase [Bacteroidales bacterium]OPZ53410.1 MAG: Aldose 1-epimerase precursor [Bacteroidetes bacterium ADurb.BinA012]MBK7732454.1 galactose mutarotase [Bacteroidales bacterium]MZQ79709.1 galactose-1-epimerase [Bacteroidales bacterium]HNY57787.1 aldose epimerase family protein [Bacteroidales bacterium]
MRKLNLFLGSVLVLFMFGISSCGNKAKEMVTTENFGSFDGKEVSLFTLTNAKGDVVKLTNYGAAIVEVNVPDRNGDKANITFGYETLDGYLAGDAYFGKVVGQYANRIAKGKFTLDEVEYTLALNNFPNSLHGGPAGWHSRVWTAEVLKGTDFPAVKFTYNKPDMEEGYPGNVVAEVVYNWTDDNELIMDYKVTTDRRSVINITNHAYFNLHGSGNGDILDHEVLIRASAFTPVDPTLIPTGELRPVEGTPFDFRTPHLIGERIGEEYDQLILGRGYDHNFVLDNVEEVDAEVYDPSTGRVLQVITDQPGVQLYTGNFLDGTQTGRGGKVYQYRSGLCLETQHFPDSPNQASFPSVILTPEEPFLSSTTYKFGVR